MKAEKTFSSMEDVVQHVDPKGIWQYWTMAMCCVLTAGVSIVVYAQLIFFTGTMQHECVLYDDGNNSASAFNFFINSTTNRHTGENATRNSVACALPNGAQCVKWNYSSPYYELTMVNEFDLVCGRTVWIPTFQSVAVWSQLIGLPLWGIISDRFGRLSTLRITYALFLAAGVAMTIVRSLVWLLVLRAFIGFVLGAVWNVCFVISMELALPERRNCIGIFVGAGWPIGAALSALLGAFIRNYHQLSMATLIFAAVCAPILFFTEESPRWMVMHEQFDQAKKLLQRHVKHANETLPTGTEFLQLIQRKKMEKDSAEVKQSQIRQMSRLLTERRLRWRTLSLFVVWMGVAFVFNGLLFYGTGSLPFFSPMLTLGVTGVIRTFAQPLYVWISNFFGGRNGMIGALIVTAISMIIMGFIPIRNSLFSTIVYALLYLVGLLAIDFDLSVIYIVTGELYPTVLRQSSLGVFSMVARVGSIAAAYAATFLAQYWLPLPAFVFGAVCVFSTLASLALPRADDAKLPETVTEAELIESAIKHAAPIELGSNACVSLSNSHSTLVRRQHREVD